MKNQFRVLAFSFIVALAFTSCSQRIDAGHEGIRVNDYSSEKGVDDVALVPGRVWHNPFTVSVYQYPTFVQTVDLDTFVVNASDGSQFTVDPTISIKVIDGRSPFIFRKYRKDLDEVINGTVYNYVKDAFRIQFNSFTTDSIIRHRKQFENMVQNMLDTSLVKEGFQMEQLTSGITYPKEIVAAITAKNTAIQDAMRVQNELVKAEANAKILVTQAKAEAERQRLLEQTLTDKLIDKQFIEKWDGKLPVYGEVPKLFKSVN